MSEDKVGPRGKRILYSRFFSGGIHKDDYNQVEEFKQNCSRKNIHMNYDGKKKRCAWSILLKRNNKIEDILIPFALASGVDADVFIDEIIEKFLENIKLECTKNDLPEKVESFRKDAIEKAVVKTVQT